MILTFTAKAQSDLRSIVITIAKDNPARSTSFVAELEQRCSALTRSPLAYAIVPRYRDKAIRRIVHDNYLIFYLVVDDTITILRVIHGSMDIDAQLTEP